MDQRRPIDGVAIVLMTATCLISGFQQIGLKATVEFAAPSFQIGIRSVAAAVIIWVLIRLRGERIEVWGPVAGAGTVAGLLFAIEYVLLAEGLKLTTASHAVVFLYSAPIFAALGLHFRVTSERLSMLQWVGMALAALGLAVAFFGRGGQSGSDFSRMVFGDLLALGAGIAWGATTIAIRISVLRTTPAAHTLFYQLTAAGVILITAAFASGQTYFEPTALLITNLVFQAVVVCAFSFLVWLWLLNRYVASQLGVFSFLTPLFGVIFGVVLLDEPLSPAFLAGAAGVLTGIVLVSVQPWLQRARARRRISTEV